MTKLAAALVLLSTFTAASAASFDGFLYTKLQAIGTRSEGPAYYLQTFDNKDIAIRKNASMWQADPVLQPHVGTKVTIEGDLVGGVLQYKSVKAYQFR